jgi:hypothetical protein
MTAHQCDGDTYCTHPVHTVTEVAIGWADLYGSDPDYNARTVEQQCADDLADRLEERAEAAEQESADAYAAANRTPRWDLAYDSYAARQAALRGAAARREANRLWAAVRVIREEADR